LAVCKARVGSSGGLERNSNIKERQDFAHLENSKFQISIDFNRFQQRISTDFNEDTILGPSFFLLNATAFSMVDGTPCRGQLRISLGAERQEWMGMIIT
jgi:hypothetical protein